MCVITYSLRDNQPGSDCYYQDAAVFTDEVLWEAEELAGQIIEAYQSFNKTKLPKSLCSREEYILEFLVLGTLWKIYSGDALGLEKVPRQLLSGLAKLRRQGGSLKPGIDFLRGILATLFLSPDLYDNMFPLEPNMTHLEKLMNWLAASGEFNQEVKRLRSWQDFLEAKTPQESSDILATAITLAIWFEARSEEVLGRYTSCVDRFLNEMRPTHYWNEDVIFCGRRRVEYHLNMVGAEILNRAFRNEFLKTRHKLVILPACMRSQSGSKCQAVKTDMELRCTGCTYDCSVNQLVMLGNKSGFDVIIVPHESSLSNVGTKNPIINSGVGAVGIACVLNLISGGWMLKEMGIPAQCVLLDYCGCRNHWHNEGIPTEINLNQLKRILGIKPKVICDMLIPFGHGKQ